MSYESVGFLGMEDAFFNNALQRESVTGEGADALALIASWPGRPKSLSKITTIGEVSTYAAAGYKVCTKKSGAKWAAAATKYFNAFVWSRRPQASVVQGKEMLAAADRAAAAAYAGDPKPASTWGSGPTNEVDLAPGADAVPRQLQGSGFMGMSPLMLVAAAGMAYFVFFKKGGRKSRGGRRARRKARRAYRKR